MSAVEKIKTYLDGRKSGVSPQELADRFLINISTVRRALKQMEKNGHAKKIPHKTTYRWVSTKSALSVAVSERVTEIISTSARILYNRPIQNSYPQVRGYDD